MFKALKFLLVGCVFIVILGCIAAVVGTHFASSWFKKKTETLNNLIGTGDSEYGKKIAELQKDYPFTPPSNDIITEEQLTRFLEVRKSVFQVWKTHEDEFKKMSAEKDPGMSAPMRTLELFNEVRMAQASALQEHHMGPDEYKYLAQMIYTTWFASATKDILKDKSITEMGKEQLQKQIDNLDKQIQDPNTNAEVKKQLQSLRDQLQDQLNHLDNNAELKKADEELNSIPDANIALFKKHETEIREYSMGGLEMLGLF